jgi:hypothetical protein
MNTINVCIFALFVLVLFYENWMPSIISWIDDRVAGK